MWADGGSWRSGSPAASLSQPGMPDDVLDLLALRSRTALLQPGLPHAKRDAGNAALPTAATSGVWRAGSIIATGNVRTGNVTRRLA